MKKIKLLVKLVEIIIVFAIVFPELGLYALVFDRGEYEPVELPPSKPIDSISQLTPRTQKRCERFLQRCSEEGLAVKITETYRTQERQDLLYEQGRTTAGPVVTWTKSSMHTERRAFDICKDVPGHGFDDEEFFRRCAEIGKEVGLSPGYYWSGIQDKPHFEFSPWWYGRGWLKSLESRLAKR